VKNRRRELLSDVTVLREVQMRDTNLKAEDLSKLNGGPAVEAKEIDKAPEESIQEQMQQAAEQEQTVPLMS
jgi:hypothetical protein